MRLPQPQTFAEGQRAVALWLLIAAGMFFGLGTVGVIALLWLGGWTLHSEGQRLGYIAVIGISYALGAIAVTLALAVGGPVGRFKGSVGRDGASAELGGRDEPHPTPPPGETGQ